MTARRILAAALVLALAGIGAGAARAEGLFGFNAPARKGEADPAQDRLLAKAAFTTVLQHKADVLGMTAPLQAQPYAPIYPEGFITNEALAGATGARVQYAAAAPVRTVLDFYEDAAALARLPFQVQSQKDGTTVFQAGDGQRSVRAVLSRQFAQSTVVDLSYR